MPDKENAFLKQNQATQFVKSSTDMFSNKMGRIFNNTAKAFSANVDIQTENASNIKVMNKSLTSINATLLAQNKMLSDNSSESLRLQRLLNE